MLALCQSEIDDDRPTMPGMLAPSNSAQVTFLSAQVAFPTAQVTFPTAQELLKFSAPPVELIVATIDTTMPCGNSIHDDSSETFQS